MKILSKRTAMQLLRIVGVGIFVWILLQIDRAQLMTHLKDADLTLFLLSVVAMFASYVPKTHRWHLLTRTTPEKLKWSDSWKLYNIGIFLGTITPAKLGEFGRVGFLAKRGLPVKTGVALSLIERLFDLVLIGGLAGVSFIILTDFHPWALMLAAVGAVLGVILALTILRKHPKVQNAFSWARAHVPPMMLVQIFFLTVIGWALYFVWAVLLARSVGIDTAAPILVGVLSIAGIVSLVPIAPAGLGTRDAAMLTLLVPRGVAATQIVAFGVILFGSLILGSLPGAWYWMRQK